MAVWLRNWRRPWSLVALALLAGSTALTFLVSPFAGWLSTPAFLVATWYADRRIDRSSAEDARE